MEDFCQNWALTVNLKQTKIIIFQKKARCQKNRFQFLPGNTAIEHSLNYIYLGLTITAPGSFSVAVNAF